MCVLVLGIDGACEGFGRLFEQSFHTLLFSCQVFDPQVIGMGIRIVHILERKHIEQERHGRDRYIDQ